MLAFPRPAAPPEAPAEGMHVGAQPHGWGAGTCSWASGQGLAAVACRAACGARGRGSPAGSGNRPGGCQACGREGGGKPDPPRRDLRSPARPRLLILALGRHQWSMSSAHRGCTFSGAGSHQPALAGGGHGSRGTAQPWASPRASPPSRWPSPRRAASQAPALPSHCPHICGLGSASPTCGHKPSRGHWCWPHQAPSKAFLGPSWSGGARWVPGETPEAGPSPQSWGKDPGRTWGSTEDTLPRCKGPAKDVATSQ